MLGLTRKVVEEMKKMISVQIVLLLSCQSPAQYVNTGNPHVDLQIARESENAARNAWQFNRSNDHKTCFELRHRLDEAENITREAQRRVDQLYIVENQIPFDNGSILQGRSETDNCNVEANTKIEGGSPVQNDVSKDNQMHFALHHQLECAKKIILEIERKIDYISIDDYILKLQSEVDCRSAEKDVKIIEAQRSRNEFIKFYEDQYAEKIKDTSTVVYWLYKKGPELVMSYLQALDNNNVDLANQIRSDICRYIDINSYWIEYDYLYGPSLQGEIGTVISSFAKAVKDGSIWRDRCVAKYDPIEDPSPKYFSDFGTYSHTYIKMYREFAYRYNLYYGRCTKWRNDTVLKHIARNKWDKYKLTQKPSRCGSTEEYVKKYTAWKKKTMRPNFSHKDYFKLHRLWKLEAMGRLNSKDSEEIKRLEKLLCYPIKSK